MKPGLKQLNVLVDRGQLTQAQEQYLYRIKDNGDILIFMGQGNLIIQFNIIVEEDDLSQIVKDIVEWKHQKLMIEIYDHSEKWRHQYVGMMTQRGYKTFKHERNYGV